MDNIAKYLEYSRLFKTCNKIEDEELFILECTINSKLRTDLFAILANENPNFMQIYSSCQNYRLLHNKVIRTEDKSPLIKMFMIN
jgi:hypothetical protein